MKIVRFVLDENPTYGIVSGQKGKEQVTAVSGDPFFQKIQPTQSVFPLSELRLLSPIIPRSKIVGVGRNYLEHAKELDNEVPKQPLLFFKPNTTVIGPGEAIVLPKFSENVRYEAELAVVIKRICKDVPLNRVPEVIFGYTCANDVTAADVQKTEQQWFRAKGFDTSCPLGPWIDTNFDPSNASIVTRLDGKVVQNGCTKDMIFGVSQLVSYISQVCTLLPGDVILTGTVAGVGVLLPGQRVEVEIENLGILSNPVVVR